MLNALHSLVATDPGISLIGVIVLIGWVAGAIFTALLAVLPLRSRYHALKAASYLAKTTHETESALLRKHVEMLKADADTRSQMYVHGLALARKVDATSAANPARGAA